MKQTIFFTFIYVSACLLISANASAETKISFRYFDANNPDVRDTINLYYGNDTTGETNLSNFGSGYCDHPANNCEEDNAIASVIVERNACARTATNLMATTLRSEVEVLEALVLEQRALTALKSQRNNHGGVSGSEAAYMAERIAGWEGDNNRGYSQGEVALSLTMAMDSEGFATNQIGLDYTSNNEGDGFWNPVATTDAGACDISGLIRSEITRVEGVIRELRAELAPIRGEDDPVNTLRGSILRMSGGDDADGGTN